jgi:type I restriction enzyme S subunit
VFDGFIDFSDLNSMAFRESEIEQYRLRRGDVLLNEGQSLELVGRAAMFTQGPTDCCFQNTLIRYRAGPEVDSEFALQLFRYCQQTGVFSAIATKTNSIAHLGVSRFAELKLPFPLLPAQHHIAELLRAWDKAIEKTERLTAAKMRVRDHLRNVHMSWSRWPPRALGDVINTVSRPIPTPRSAYKALGIRSHGKGTFQRLIERPEEIDMETVYKVAGRDLIVNITFAWEGAIALAKAEDDGCLVSHRFPTFAINECEFDREFLGYVVRSKRFVRDLGIASPGGAGRNRVLNKKDFLAIRIPSPPRERQREIAQLLNAADLEIALLGKQRDALTKQKRGLMQKLLTGEWRVPRRDGDVDAFAQRAAEAAE